MEPSTRIFVQGVKNGKDVGDAFEDYCWSRLVVPVHRGDGIASPEIYSADTHFLIRGLRNNIKSDDSEEKIANDFHQFIKDSGIYFKAMEKRDRPTAGMLLAKLDEKDLVTAKEILGEKFVRMSLIFEKSDRHKRVKLSDAPPPNNTLHPNHSDSDQ